jgi:hypothetical protein
MRVRFHPEFPADVRNFTAEYTAISVGLGARFRREADEAVEAIISSPSGAGHFLQQRSEIVPELRRRNFRAFPFFVLYGLVGDDLIFGSVIPSRSDPLTWLTRFEVK